LRWQRVKASTLDDIHAVNTKSFDLYNGLPLSSRRLGRFGVDEEGITLASATANIWKD